MNHRLMLVLASALALSGSAFAAPKVVEANVAFVVDGDTAVLEDGTTVHYIGLEAPAKPVTGRGGEPYGQECFELNKKLVSGKRVRLELDAKGKDDKGAVLAYVHVGKFFVNATLVQSGYARAAVRSPNTRYAALFERLQAEAREAKRGLWNAARNPAPTFGNDALASSGSASASSLTNADLERYDIPGEDEAVEEARRAQEAAQAAPQTGDASGEEAAGSTGEGTPAPAGEAAPAPGEEAPVPPTKER